MLENSFRKKLKQMIWNSSRNAIGDFLNYKTRICEKSVHYCILLTEVLNRFVAMGLVLRPSNVTSEFAWGINFELDFPKFLDIWVTEWFKSFQIVSYAFDFNMVWRKSIAMLPRLKLCNIWRFLILWERLCKIRLSVPL